MTCDEVRERLPEHVLGTLDDVSDLAIRRHLRGCAGCRREMEALGEGLALFARASHDAEPPPDLQERVMATLADEWRDDAVTAPPPRPRRARGGWITAVAAAIALVVALTWGVTQHARVHSLVASDRYTQLLNILGGKGFRAGTLQPANGAQVQGSAVVYDSHEGQSWVAVFVRGPGLTGPAHATLTSPDGREIDLYDLHIRPDGTGSAWLVTAQDLQGFDHVTVTGAAGTTLASTTLRPA